MFELSQSFSFDAAHTLVRHSVVSECVSSKRIHGHTFYAEVAVKGEMVKDGYLARSTDSKKAPIEFFDLYNLRSEVDRVREMLDHQFLDEVPGLGPGTLENLCLFIASEVDLPVSRVSVWRSTGDRCNYFTVKSSPNRRIMIEAAE